MGLWLDLAQQAVSNNPQPSEPMIGLPAAIIAVIAALGLQPYLGKIWAALVSLLESTSAILSSRAKERGVRIAVAQSQLEQNEYLFGKVQELTETNVEVTKTNVKLGEANAALGSLLVEERKDYNKDRETWRQQIATMTQTATERDGQISTALQAASEYKTKYENELGLRTAAEERERLANERAERLQIQVDSLLKLQSGTIEPTITEGVKDESHPA